MIFVQFPPIDFILQASLEMHPSAILLLLTLTASTTLATKWKCPEGTTGCGALSCNCKRKANIPGDNSLANTVFYDCDYKTRSNEEVHTNMS